MRRRQADVFVDLEADDLPPVDVRRGDQRGKHLELRGPGGHDDAGLVAVVNGQADMVGGVGGGATPQFLRVAAEDKSHGRVPLDANGRDDSSRFSHNPSQTQALLASCRLRPIARPLLFFAGENTI